MLIFNEHNQPVIIDNINGPILSDYMWVLDFDLEGGDMDYTLTKLLILEETHCASLKLMIDGFSFFVPASWNILVVDEETTELDAVQVAAVAGRKFNAVITGPTAGRINASEIVVVDYHPNFKNVGPCLKKHHMLCHPIGPNAWVNIAPSDSYKYLKERTLADLT